MLFGWLAADGGDAADVLVSMAAALRVTAEERATVWTLGALGIGLLERPFADDESRCEPARAADGSALWMSGEAFDWPSHGGIRRASESRSLAFRTRLLAAVAAEGAEAIRDLDGEYQIAFWNARERTLLLLNDRFAALPMYVATGRRGVAFAGGVRGVLMAPGVDTQPDADAIREAVSFGGHRLGGRTNVRGVAMLPPAAAVTMSVDGLQTRRYWTWAEVRDGDATDPGTLMEETRSAWTNAVARRLDGARRPGLTLSGGLDSRAILAEAAVQQAHVTALTYGVPQSDDVKIARRAARAAGAEWRLHPLYAEGWLERRTQRIHETDGLMDLVDLMHAEPLETMTSAFDVYLSGYIGDVVSGATYLDIRNPAELLAAMPYYGGRLALPFREAQARAGELIAKVPGLARFAPYEHKLPQAIGRITAAARPYTHVRRPFVDYRFFETAQRVPHAWRRGHRWHEKWLRSTYPALFRIPNQRTGVPPGSSRLRWQTTRVARYGWRHVLKRARAAGLPVVVPERSYHPDERYWSQPAERDAIERTIMRPGSISCEVFGRSRVDETVRAFFSQGAAPVQVIGALYVFERYHQTLAASLADARRQVTQHAC
ncbi:MAG TPA: asparagine synthase-related protein [Vicinamibacterales bacterium]|nr:asparagine synthase-related protein [Vicinamibacterales bacterium]